jgi:hypothetical protein
VVHVSLSEACRHLCGTHPQTGQVGVGRSSAMWAWGTVPLCKRGGTGVRFHHVGRGMGAGQSSEHWRWLGTRRSMWDAMEARGVGAAS